MYKIFTELRENNRLKWDTFNMYSHFKIIWAFSQNSNGHYDIQIKIYTFSLYFVSFANVHRLFSHFRQLFHAMK